MIDTLTLFKRFFEGKYVYYILIPVILTLLFAFFAFVYPSVPQGIDLKGGTLVILRTDKAIDSQQLEEFLSKEFDFEDLSITSTSSLTGHGVVIQFAYEKSIFKAEQAMKTAQSLLSSNEIEARKNAETALSLISSFNSFREIDKPQETKDLVVFASDAVDKSREIFESRLQDKIRKEFSLSSTSAFQIREIGPTIGPIFWNNAIFVLIVAIISIIVIIFLFFREIIPSIAIILAASFDVLTALGLMALTGISLSLASIPALLMLIGYSVDTDIMLTTKVLKRKNDTIAFRAAQAMRTGLTMTLTSVAAAFVMVILAYLNQMLVIFEIAAVIFFGLIGDIISTWLMNAPILLWYAERKNKNR